MRKNITQEAAGFLAGARRRRIWLKVVSVLGCVVVFCTTYALILPAITMEKTRCGLTEHTHTADCYTQVTAVTRQEPVCSLESLDLHEHTEDCFDENGEPICGYADFVVHEHDASCYDEDGRLWCPLPEIKAHTHSEDCYATPQTLAVHTQANEQGGLTCTEATEAEAEPELICDQEEIMLHEHVSSCFDANGNLICGKTQVLEHVHSDACFETVEEAVDTEALTCGLEEHQHDETCMAGGIATANADEIPDEILKNLTDAGIYPGTKVKDQSGNVVWTARDAADEGTATIKATVTLSAKDEERDSYYLYLAARPENLDVLNATLQDLVGAYNDAQCYDIGWVHVYQDENLKWLYETEALKTPATVQIEYPNDSGLKGENAQRKLLVYSWVQDTLTETELTAVAANETAYTGFTFQTESGGPFVFVSKTVAKGYVHNLSVNKIIDGVSPFDSDDKPGNDSSASNRKVL